MIEEKEMPHSAERLWLLFRAEEIRACFQPPIYPPAATWTRILSGGCSAGLSAVRDCSAEVAVAPEPVSPARAGRARTAASGSWGRPSPSSRWGYGKVGHLRRSGSG